MSVNRISPQHTILLVEDSPEDYEITKRSFVMSGLANPLVWCSTGDEALDYLFRQGKYVDLDSSKLPGIILLDLNLPGTDGREVLRTCKADERFKPIPIIVLTTSSDPRDIHDCYQDGANSYVVKPVSVDGFVQALQRMQEYWFEVVVFPKND